MSFAKSVYNVCFFVCGVLLPAYGSSKALQADNVKIHRHWIAYWVVWSLLAVFKAFEDALDFGVLYFAAKIAFIAWLSNPATRGSIAIYEAIIAPAIQNGGTVEKVVEHCGSLTQNLRRLPIEAYAKAMITWTRAQVLRVSAKIAALKQQQFAGKTIPASPSAAKPVLVNARQTPASK